MSLDVKIEVQSSHLHVRVLGENTPENFSAYLYQVRDAAIQHGQTNVLIEEHLNGPPMDRFELFRVITERTPEAALLKLRIAFVDTAHQPDREGMELGESLANQRGVELRAFTEVEPARRWLAGKGDIDSLSRGA